MFVSQLTVDVLRANYEKEVDQLKTMMPDDQQSSSQDAAVVGTGLMLYLLYTISPFQENVGQLSQLLI